MVLEYLYYVSEHFDLILVLQLAQHYHHHQVPNCSEYPGM